MEVVRWDPLKASDCNFPQNVAFEGHELEAVVIVMVIVLKS